MGNCRRPHSWGSGDTMMTLETETDENNKFQYYLKATLDMSAGNKWKIRLKRNGKTI